MTNSMKTILLLSALSLFAFGCGGGGGNDEDSGTDASTADASDASDPSDAGDAGPDCVEDPTTIPAQATFETNLRFLNQCTTSQFRDFDNTTRIAHPLYVPGGPYPAF